MNIHLVDNEIAIKEDPILSAMAKKIFGENIIKSAFVITYAYNSCTPEEIKDRLEKQMFLEIKENINVDNKDIIILFTSGRAVLFTNSEWGTILCAGHEI